MVTAIIMFFVVATAAWVYWDASNHKVGRVDGEKGFFNMSAGYWSTFMVFTWIPALPLYLFKRSGLIEKAKSQPVEPSRAVGFSVLAVLFAWWLVNAVAAFMEWRGATEKGALAEPTMQQQSVQQVQADIPPGAVPLVPSSRAGAALFDKVVITDAQMVFPRTDSQTYLAVQFTSSQQQETQDGELMTVHMFLPTTIAVKQGYSIEANSIRVLSDKLENASEISFCDANKNDCAIETAVEYEGSN